MAQLGQTNPTGSEPVWHRPAHGVPQSAKEIQRLKLTGTAIMLSLFSLSPLLPFKNIYLQRKSESLVMTIEKRVQNHVWPSNLQFLQPLNYVHIKIRVNFCNQYLPEEWYTFSIRIIPLQHHFNAALPEKCIAFKSLFPISSINQQFLH